MAGKTDTSGAPEGYAEVKELEKEQIDAAFPEDPWPASPAKLLEDHEQRIAFLEARVGLVKPIVEHEYDASEHVVPASPASPRALYRATGVVEGMQAQNADADASLDDLKAEAADLDVKGRSSMNKAELEKAVDEARASK